MFKSYIIVVGLSALFAHAAIDDTPEYILPCRKNDPQLISCISNSIEHLRPYLAKGIPEIEVPSIEPFIMDQLSLQLTDGPQGYKITMKNMEVYGASNFQVKTIKLSENGRPFEATIAVPKLSIESKYTSSGVLIIIPASGGGELHAILEGALANITGKASTKSKSGGTFLHVDSLHLNLGIQKVHMSISKAFNNNRILTEATNLFLRENGIEVVRAMQPQLEKKLAQEFAKIANQLLKYIPVEKFYLD